MCHPKSTGDTIILKSFHGTLTAPKNIEPAYNYWLLIGKEGSVIRDEEKIHPMYKSMGSQILVKFNDDLSHLGLENHNEVKNALWIFIKDLEFTSPI